FLPLEGGNAVRYVFAKADAQRLFPEVGGFENVGVRRDDDFVHESRQCRATGKIKYIPYWYTSQIRIRLAHSVVRALLPGEEVESHRGECFRFEVQDAVGLAGEHVEP